MHVLTEVKLIEEYFENKKINFKNMFKIKKLTF